MITIVKGNDKIVCTKSMFEEQFKVLGYQIAPQKKEGATKSVVPSLNENEEQKEVEGWETNVETEDKQEIADEQDKQEIADEILKKGKSAKKGE